MLVASQNQTKNEKYELVMANSLDSRTQFRIWATSVLKDHLIRGYTLNQRRLAEKDLGGARQMRALLDNTLERHQLVNDEGLTVLSIVCKCAKTW